MNNLEKILIKEGWKYSDFAQAADLSDSYHYKIRRGAFTSTPALQNRTLKILNSNTNEGKH